MSGAATAPLVAGGSSHTSPSARGEAHHSQRADLGQEDMSDGGGEPAASGGSLYFLLIL